MVERVREGDGLREVARAFRVSLSTVQRWVARAGEGPLDEVNWEARPPGCRVLPRRTKDSVEKRVLAIRKSLRTKSDLGEYGPAAIHRELVEQQAGTIPTVPTLARILSRRGVLDGRQRVRHQAPPRGWSLPDVAALRADIDNFDGIEDLVIRGGIRMNVLTGISLHGGLCAAWPVEQITAKTTMKCLVDHGREVGLPRYAKFDNATIFQGDHAWPDTFGRVIRMCPSLKVTPMFAPPLSRGFPADIEAFNRRWQDSVWSRFTYRNRPAVMAQSDRFVAVHRRRPDSLPLPQKLDAEPPATAERNRDLPPRNRRSRPSHRAGTNL